MLSGVECAKQGLGAGGGGASLTGEQKRGGGGVGLQASVRILCSYKSFVLFCQSALQACDGSSSVPFDSRHQMHPVQDLDA